MLERLILADGVRFPEADEMPDDADYIEALERLKSAQLVPGYLLVPLDDDSTFSFMAVINAHPDDLWACVVKLLDLFPAQVSAFVGTEEYEPEVSKRADKSVVLSILEPFRYELCHDGMLDFGFGVDVETAESMIQLRVTPEKCIQFWGPDLERFRALMSELKLGENPDLAFVGDFPVITEPVDGLDVTPYDEVFEAVVGGFVELAG